MAVSNSGKLMTRSGTTVVAARSFDVFKIEGYSRALHNLSARPSFNSRPFRAAGRSWQTIFQPKGSPQNLDNTDSISFAIHLVDAVDEAVTALATFTLLDQGGMPVHIYTQTTRAKTLGEPGKDRFIWCEKFMKRRDLELSEYLEGDCFSIRVHVHIVKEAPSVVVPPSNIHRHMGTILSSKQDTDVEFLVGEETFAAHRLLLGARSPVFQAELFGPMQEGAATNIIRIDDMEPQVFRALLTFVYTDTWPEIDEEDDEAVMAQHLLVAADRYGLERLKMMCVDRLCDRIDTRSAATILALAEQHGCLSLKKACFEFLLSSKEKDSLAAVIETEDFGYLARSCPEIVKEIISRLLLARDPEKAKVDELCGHPHHRLTMDTPISPDAMQSGTVSVKAYHVLKIDGFSMTREALRDFGCISSCPFRAGGYNWYVSIHPKGTSQRSTDFISFFLVRVDVVDEAVMVQVTFSLVDQDQKPVHTYSHATPMADISVKRSIGFHGLFRRDILERSGFLKDDCLTVRIDMHIVKTLPLTAVIVPPPPDMQKHLGDLLLNKEGMDVEFRVAGETFGAHRLILAARSPVFRAELRASANDGSTVNVVEIHDMDAQAFKALLSFVYTDTWPDMNGEEDEFAMAQRILGAADRYGMQRLKLMCEDRLWNHIDTCSAATILELAEKHHCPRLKKACFEFLCSSSAALGAVVETDEFKSLARRYPTIIEELTSDIRARNQEKGAVAGWNLESHKNCIKTPVTQVLQLKAELLLNIGFLFAE